LNILSAVPENETPLPDLDTEALAREIALLARDAKAEGVAVLRVLELVQYTDWFVVCSARSDRHARAIYDEIWDAMSFKGLKPISSEGVDAGQWVLADYGSVVVHIFYEPVREFYALERLWSDAPRLDLPDVAPMDARARA
jgi:ribosome-associated protein